MTQTTGQELTATLRTYFKVGSRTRRYRGTQDLHESMIEMIEINNQYPGYYNTAQTAALAPGYVIALNYRKHVGGHRIDGLTYRHISEMSAYRFAELLGQMIDAGVTNAYEGEQFFKTLCAA